MKRLLTAWLLLFATLVLATSSVSEGAAPVKAKVVVTERGKSEPEPPRGAFVLQGAAGRDSGRTVISVGPDRVRVNATEFLYGKHGQLTVTFAGVRVAARAGDRLHGTWRILAGFGTGTYKSWKGGGTWTGTENGARYTLRFEGLITRGR